MVAMAMRSFSRTCLFFLALLAGSPASATKDDPQATGAHCPNVVAGAGGPVFTVDYVATPNGAGQETTVTPAVLGKIGRYEIIREISKGGQAIVYEARHPTLGKTVVVKLSRFPAKDDAIQRDRLVQEGRLLAQLEHPNLGAIYDLEFHDNHPFLVLEFIKGINLAQHAQHVRLTPRQIATIVAKIGRALGESHRNGIIHQDLKPMNVVMSESGEPKVIDFGLARIRNAWADESQLEDTISGTPAYMSPEQARADHGSVSAQTDVFGMGGILYYLLTGKPPFEAKSPADAIKRAKDCDFDRAALNARGIPATLRAIALRALQAKQADRYPSADDMAADLEWFVRRPTVVRNWATGTAAALLAAAGIAWSVHHFGASPPVVVDFAPPPVVQVVGESRISLWVMRDDDMLDLQGALPVKTGDQVQAVVSMPPGLKPTLFWLDTEGKLHSRPVTKAGGSSESDRFLYPGPEKYVSVGGKAGAEFMIVVASPDAAPMADDVKEIIGEGKPFPSLPSRYGLVMARDQVRLISNRGPDEVVSRPDASFRERAEIIRQKLAEKYPVVVGIAFPHE